MTLELAEELTLNLQQAPDVLTPFRDCLLASHTRSDDDATAHHPMDELVAHRGGGTRAEPKQRYWLGDKHRTAVTNEQLGHCT